MNGTAHRLVIDAVIDVLAARIAQDLPGLSDTEARSIAARGMADVLVEGWLITALPPHTCRQQPPGPTT